jgi:hypothetical protein
VAGRSRGLSVFAFEEAEVKSTFFLPVGIGLGLTLVAYPVHAQWGHWNSSSSPSNPTSSVADKPWATPNAGNFQEIANSRHLGLGLTTSGFIVGGRWEVANGGIVEIDVVWRKGFNKYHRIEVGGIGRFAFTPDASLIGVGIPVRGILRMDDRLEMNFELILSYSRMIYNTSFFPASNGFIPSLRWGIGYYVDRRVAIGVNPLAFSVVTGERVDPFLTYEPGIFVRFSPL